MIVKGDLSADGTAEEWAAFEGCYRTAFGDRLQRGARQPRCVPAPGRLRRRPVDRTARTGGRPARHRRSRVRRPDDHDRADRLARRPHRRNGPTRAASWATTSNGSPGRADHAATTTSGSIPIPARPSTSCASAMTHVVGYAAGHTHRHRVRPMTRSGVASIEVGCTKDFPGTWAEYRVFDGGVMQVVHRMSSPAALEWSESCRAPLRRLRRRLRGVRARLARRPLLRHPVPLTGSVDSAACARDTRSPHDRLRHRVHPRRHATVRITGRRGRRRVARTRGAPARLEARAVHVGRAAARWGPDGARRLRRWGVRVRQPARGRDAARRRSSRRPTSSAR